MPLKLSQIAPASSPPAATDQVVAVTGGAVDNLVTVSQLTTGVITTLPAAGSPPASSDKVVGVVGGVSETVTVAQLGAGIINNLPAAGSPPASSDQVVGIVSGIDKTVTVAQLGAGIINNLPAAGSPPASTDKVVGVVGGVNETVTVSQLSSSVLTNLPAQSAHTVLAGPTSGGAVTPTFRTLGSGDLPSGAVSQLSTSSPTGTTSTTFVMAGMGGIFVITPQFYTRVLVIITCQLSNSVANDVSIVRLRFGTGTAPANGAAETGTQIGQLQAIINNANTAGLSVPCTMAGIMSSLTPSTTYWIDMSQEVTGGGTVTFINPGLVAFEFP